MFLAGGQSRIVHVDNAMPRRISCILRPILKYDSTRTKITRTIEQEGEAQSGTSKIQNAVVH